MILTCPACATSYFIPDNAIGPNGRRVRCKSCSHDWRAVAEDAPLDLGEVASAFAPAPSSPLSEAPEPEPIVAPLPQAFRARQNEKRKAQKAARQGLAWALLVILVAGSLGFAYLMRDRIVSRVPTLASAYKAVGIQTNVVGLEFEAVNARYAAHDPSHVVVSGALRNIRSHEIVAPAIRISIRDQTGREIDHKILKLDAAPVLPGQVQGFADILPNPGGQFASVATTFILAPSSAAKPAQPTPKRDPAALNTEASIDADPIKESSKADGLRRVGTLPPDPVGLDK